jgi:hypothetical protein
MTFIDTLKISTLVCPTETQSGFNIDPLRERIASLVLDPTSGMLQR